jgi:EmrB/QacA subfamily drug resistance transporter
VFLCNVPVGIVLSILAARVLADPPELAARRRTRLGAGLNLDYVGFALLVVGMGALQIVLDKGQEDDWFGSAFITRLAVISAASLAAFVVWELRRADPIVDLKLLADRNFAVGNLLMFVLGFGLLATTALLPLFVQTLLGYTATDAGLVLSPGGFALMLTMPLVGALSGKIDARLLIAFGFAGTAAALYAMTRFNGAIDYATIAWARVYQSLPLALLFIPINTADAEGQKQQCLGDHQHGPQPRRQLRYRPGDNADRPPRAISSERARRARQLPRQPVQHRCSQASTGVSRVFRERRRCAAAGGSPGLQDGAAASRVAVVQRLLLDEGV